MNTMQHSSASFPSHPEFGCFQQKLLQAVLKDLYIWESLICLWDLVVKFFTDDVKWHIVMFMGLG